jgi:hypothetical protein
VTDFLHEQGWKWTYNDLIVGHLWGLVIPGAPQGTIIAIIHLLGLLGRYFLLFMSLNIFM